METLELSPWTGIMLLMLGRTAFDERLQEAKNYADTTFKRYKSVVFVLKCPLTLTLSPVPGVPPA